MDELRARSPMAGRLMEDARDIHDVAWRHAQLDLYEKVMQVMLRLGIWVGLVVLFQVAIALGVAYLIWRTL